MRKSRLGYILGRLNSFPTLPIVLTALECALALPCQLGRALEPFMIKAALFLITFATVTIGYAIGQLIAVFTL